MQNIIQILIIEDDILVAHNLKLTLIDFGYDVVKICYDYQEALTAIENCIYDIVLLDINLGNHIKDTGIDIAKNLLTSRREPFIFLTAFSDKETIQKATSLKPAAYLIKPISGPAVYAAIQTALSNQLNSVIPNLSDKLDIFPVYFFSKIGNKITKVYWKDVIIMESIKNYVRIITNHQNKEYLIRSSLSKVKNNIFPKQFHDDFIMVNRSIFLKKSSINGVTKGIIYTDFGNFNSSKECYKEINNYISKHNSII
jgi:DNA-binding LytR/AlgR family response regulator